MIHNIIIIGIVCYIVIFLFFWRMEHLQDKSEGEPVLTERAKLHAKSEYSIRYSYNFYLHFYVPERDTVVECKVEKSIWQYIEKGDWGMLCHQGGRFFSFDRNGEVIAVKNLNGTSIDMMI